jgi:hypothetical protein
VVLGFAVMIARAEVGIHRTFAPAVALKERLNLSRPESHRDRPSLTSVGAFLFVSVPMIASGALLI